MHYWHSCTTHGIQKTGERGGIQGYCCAPGTEDRPSGDFFRKMKLINYMMHLNILRFRQQAMIESVVELEVNTQKTKQPKKTQGKQKDMQERKGNHSLLHGLAISSIYIIIIM